MKKLSYATLKEQNYDGYLLEDAPERVLQFGEGNFLRAFVDYFIDVLNEKAGFNSKVVLCQPIAPGLADMINEQEGLYTLLHPLLLQHLVLTLSYLQLEEELLLLLLFQLLRFLLILLLRIRNQTGSTLTVAFLSKMELLQSFPKTYLIS